MGIYCELSVSKPLDGEFLPGDQVSGSIKYSVDEETVFNRVTVSLKGIGRVEVVDSAQKGNTQYRNTKHYVDIDHVDYNEKGVATIPNGIYERIFKFELPRDIPSSLVYSCSARGLYIKCKIVYYIRIKFERPGLLDFDKRFKQEITVRSGVTPTLSTEPLLRTKQFRLVKIRPDNTIDVKACIENPVVNANGTIKFSYEISNNTNVQLEGVNVKVKEMYTFKVKGQTIKKYNDVEGTSSKSGSIAGGATQIMGFEINLPPNVCNIQNSTIISRDYFVKVKILLPLFRVNREVKIPFEVGEVIEDRAGGFDAPPSYWEAMAECKKGWSDDDDDAED